MAKLIAVDFEIFGRVQGVFFRKYTQKMARELQLRGWCRNTDTGTVQGQLEGPPTNVDKMQDWLQRTGSPQSKVSSAKFTNRVDIDEFSHKDFSVRH